MSALTYEDGFEDGYEKGHSDCMMEITRADTELFDESTDGENLHLGFVVGQLEEDDD